MVSIVTSKNLPHVVCIPYPAQARGPDSLNGLPSFRFETIPDGLPESDVNATQDIPSLCESTRKTCLPHFKNLLSKLNNAIDTPPVTCIVSDGVMTFTLDAAEELNIPEVLFWTTSACGFMCYMQHDQLIERGLTPLKDSSYITNGYLETTINWVPGIKEIRLKDIPSFFRTTNPNDIMIDTIIWECKRAQKASAIILNSFDNLEHNVLEAFSSLNLPPVYSIEIEDAKRDKIEDLVRELIDGEKGKVMKEKALQWKKLAQNAVSSPHGSSFVNLKNLFCDVLSS
ncbi:7-deoxyloganetin glucosyltransferase [Trifolium repens]|nr:7-deoxyloganetin glucosyltransferase [Trifolium repens]